FAAVTSSISLLETSATYAIDERGWSRGKAVLLLGGIMALLGVPSSLAQGIWEKYTVLGMPFLDLMSFLTDNIMLPLCAFLMCIYIAFTWRTRNACEEIGLKGTAAKVYSFIIAYVAPISIAIIFIYGLLPFFGVG
ncbi:MAG: sodium-dependent transporter, partial [Clostridia bacterium]|nr:sodium-dependent transporter [Clostridia bacterium]